MRTQEEIMGRIRQSRPNDFFGFKTMDLYLALTRKNFVAMAKEFKAKTTQEELDGFDQAYPDDESVRKQIRGYMPFAFEKAINHRGISAGRSVNHYQSWLWLIGDDELSKFADNTDSNYQNYGVPILKKIAEAYMIELPKSDAFECMARGEMCPGCHRGETSGCDY